MNILEDLWYGNLCPIDRGDYRTGDYRDLVLLYERNESKLLPTLTDLQKDTLEKMRDSVTEMRGIAECNAFMTGFRLAIQLMTASIES